MAKRQAPKTVRRHVSSAGQVAAQRAARRRSAAHIENNDLKMGVRKSARVMAAYEAAGNGKRAQSKWLHASTTSIRYELGRDLPTVIRRCRYEVRNNPIANALVEFIAATTVGTGIRPRITDPELLTLWNEFVEEADADGLDDLYQLQLLMMREIVASGEVFVRLRRRKKKDGLAVPMQIQVLPSEFVPLHEDDTRGIISGVQMGEIGQRQAYLFHQTHPGDGKAVIGHKYSEVPAGSVCHIFDRREGGQIRGEPWLVRSIIRLHELDEFEDAELVKANFSARITSFFKRKSPIDPTSGQMINTEEEEDESDLSEVIRNPEAGSGMVMPDDYDVEFAPTHETSAQFPHFVRQVLAEACVGLAPVDLILDRDIPERSQQLILAKYETIVEQRRKMLIQRFLRPLWAAFLEAVEQSGRYKGDLSEHRRVKWTGQPLPKIRRHQEAQADVIELRAGTVTHAEIVEKKGHDYAEHIERLSKEAQDREDRGLVLTIDPRHVSNAGVSQANDFYEGEISGNDDDT